MSPGFGVVVPPPPPLPSVGGVLPQPLDRDGLRRLLSNKELFPGRNEEGLQPSSISNYLRVLSKARNSGIDVLAERALDEFRSRFGPDKGWYILKFPDHIWVFAPYKCSHGYT